jgi:hypothetical protein
MNSRVVWNQKVVAWDEISDTLTRLEEEGYSFYDVYPLQSPLIGFLVLYSRIEPVE